MKATSKPKSGSAGRPPIDGETKTVIPVRVTKAQIATAKKLGAGNFAAGVRLALDRAKAIE